MHDLLVGLTAIFVLGIGAQWLSWRLRLPAILMLLIAGFVAGPIAGVVDPDAFLGDLLFPIVSLSVAIILFEGGLSLDVAELREIGRVVRNLVSIGVLVTWVGATALAMWLLDLRFALAILLGAILVVTGPTVIIPLLRHVRPAGRIGSTIRWEGIVNDPIGAILAVLVLEGILSGGVGEGALAAARGVVWAGVIGGTSGLVGAGLLVLLIKRYWVPDFLQNPVSLTMVLVVFTLSNSLQAESGLLAVTVMGAALASQRSVTVHHIVEFKEVLRVLLISALFILLAARLPLTDPDYTATGSLLFLAALILVVRPTAVALATAGSTLTWRERVFLGFMAPRGIVAAAISSLVALRLADSYPEAARLVPTTFLVIAGTVGIYGLTAPWVARRLGLAAPNPRGVLLVGASGWARAIAHALQAEEIRTLVADSNWSNVRAARNAGLETYYGNVLAEQAMDAMDLSDIGRMLALTPNDEVNALAALHFGEEFGTSNVYQLPPEGNHKAGPRESIPKHLRGRLLFAPEATHEHLERRFRAGAVIKKNRLTDEFGLKDFRALYGESAIPLFLIRESGAVAVLTITNPPTPKAGQVLISLVDERG